ncbi:MAG: iron-sulfur cluster repair di-iron protein [Pyrinomonadaceae bacterium]
MYNFQEKTIREIALDAPLTIRVFEKHKIDFCCGGRVPFAEACSNAGVDPSAVLSELESVSASSDPKNDVDTRSARELIDHIVCTHHAFTRAEVQRLMPLAEKVATRHGEHHPELVEIRDIVLTLGNEMLVHMQKEEMMLFPYIEKLERAAETNGSLPLPPFGTVNNPVRMMMFEHDQAGEMLRSIRSLSSDYATPEDACPSFKGLFAGLQDLEADLHQHIHLENNILFPQAIDFETQVFSTAGTAAV